MICWISSSAFPCCKAMSQDIAQDILQESLHTPLLGEYDLIVAGGGVAGACAAVAARRFGVEKVLLLEKGILFGGLATQGLIALYEPICDGEGHKITYGMGAELMHLCRKYGPDALPPQWEEDPDEVELPSGRYTTFFSPAVFALALDEFILSAGVKVLLDTQIVKPIMEGTVCRGLVVENKTGRGYFKAKTVIDTTGDADLFHRAGAPCKEGRNFLSLLSYRTDVESLQEGLKQQNMLKARRLVSVGSGPRGNGHPEGMPLMSGTTAEEVTEFALTGRKLLLDSIRQENRLTRDVSILPTMAQFRTTRHIQGARVVTEADLKQKLPEAIARIGDFLQPGDWYEIPYGSLYVPGYPNLWTAGRSLAAEGWAWDVLRIIPGCACSGQAAGISAGLCLKEGYTADTLPYQRLLLELKKQGNRPHGNE